MKVDESIKNKRRERWRLILGEQADPNSEVRLSGTSKRLDQALEFLYKGRSGKGRTPSSPKINQWLNEIRDLFEADMVQELQKEAISRLGIEKLVLEKEFLQNAEPNIELLANIIHLSQLMNDEVKDVARKIVGELVEEIEKQLTFPIQTSINRGKRRPMITTKNKPQDIHWHKTIMTNLKHYQPNRKFLIPEIWKGHKKELPSFKDVILVIDQSASMNESIIYSAIIGSILSSVRSLKTKTYLFDTEVVDVSDHLHDIVDLLFSIQLGGGTNISKALKVVINNLSRPSDTILFLISDLEDSGDETETQNLFQFLVQEGVQCFNLVSMSDKGKPRYNHDLAEKIKRIGVPYMYGSPKAFPELLERALHT